MKKLTQYAKLIVCMIAFPAASCASAQFDLGKLIDAGVQTIQNATATTNFTADDLVGTWDYVSPAISFKGDNALSNIGGAAASTAVENKLSTYYNKAGLQNSKLTVNSDHTFTWKLGVANLSGTIEKSGTSDLVFNFSAFGKINIGKINCMATKSGSNVNLTFDASKLLNLAQKISSVSSNSSFQAVNSLLSNYEDMYIGFKMKKGK